MGKKDKTVSRDGFRDELKVKANQHLLRPEIRCPMETEKSIRAERKGRAVLVQTQAKQSTVDVLNYELEVD